MTTNKFLDEDEEDNMDSDDGEDTKIGKTKRTKKLEKHAGNKEGSSGVEEVSVGVAKISDYIN